MDGQRRFWGWPWKKNGDIPWIVKELGGKPAFSCFEYQPPNEAKQKSAANGKWRNHWRFNFFVLLSGGSSGMVLWSSIRRSSP